MSAGFRNVVLAMAAERPKMQAATLVALALAVEGATPPADLDDPNALALWARRQPEVAQYIAAGKKIHTIKEIRTLTGASLKQAKDAADVMPGWPR